MFWLVNCKIYLHSFCQLTDINECDTNNGGCQHNCINNEGSYDCHCREGYNINNTNGHSCIGMCI